MEKTMYMIKPEGMPHRDKISELLARNGLTVLERKTLILPEWAIDVLYPELSCELRLATTVMLSSVVEVGLVQGDNAILKLLRVVGTKTVPTDCEPDSIRFLFGDREPVIVEGARYYTNIMHRPQNPVEAERDIALYHKL